MLSPHASLACTRIYADTLCIDQFVESQNFEPVSSFLQRKRCALCPWCMARVSGRKGLQCHYACVLCSEVCLQICNARSRDLYADATLVQSPRHLSVSAVRLQHMRSRERSALARCLVHLCERIACAWGAPKLSFESMQLCGAVRRIIRDSDYAEARPLLTLTSYE
jgi:hypothetical protein